jgi:hypothetical protein
LGHAATLRFPSLLIEPDVRISRIRLSGWLHREAHETKHGPQASSARCALFLRHTIQLSLKDLEWARRKIEFALDFGLFKVDGAVRSP